MEALLSQVAAAVAIDAADNKDGEWKCTDNQKNIRNTEA